MNMPSPEFWYWLVTWITGLAGWCMVEAYRSAWMQKPVNMSSLNRGLVIMGVVTLSRFYFDW